MRSLVKKYRKEKRTLISQRFIKKKKIYLSKRRNFKTFLNKAKDIVQVRLTNCDIFVIYLLNFTKEKNDAFSKNRPLVKLKYDI